MKIYIMFLLLLVTSAITAVAFDPEIHSTIMLDAKFFGGEEANHGDANTTNKFAIRKAAFSIEGQLQDNMKYALEGGIATCVSNNSGNTFQLMDASLMYELYPNINVGLQKGHIMRSFSSTTECANRLAMEKPIFEQEKVYAGCHLMGFVADGYFELGEISGIEAEIAVLNGNNDHLDQAHYYNLGVRYDSPLTGLSVLGSVSRTKEEYWKDQVKTHKEGYRAVAGVNYQAHNIWTTFEYFTGRGFSGNPDQIMNSWYAQAGYEISVGIKHIHAIVPYVMLESWEKDKDVEDTTYRYIEPGVTLKVSSSTKLKCAYREEIMQPDGEIEAPTSFIIRLQSGF